MKVNFNLKNPKGTDKTPIFVTVVYKTKRVRVQTNKSIKPGEWNKDEQKARQVLSGYSSFNKWLKDIDAYVSQIEMDWINSHSKQTTPPSLPIELLKEKLRVRSALMAFSRSFRPSALGVNAEGTRIRQEAFTSTIIASEEIHPWLFTSSVYSFDTGTVLIIAL